MLYKMNKITLLISVVLCLAIADARSFDDKRREGDSLSLVDDEGHNNHGDTRHRRRRWQMSYGYDYPTPLPGFYPERREYDRNDRNQQDVLLTKIIKLLEDISAQLNRPPPPQAAPQPIYISYPVPYPLPSYNPCPPQGPSKVNITSRFPDMEDTNQNWGWAPSAKDDDSKFVSDGARPISFDPIKPVNTLRRPAPTVEHGSVQADNSHTTLTPKFESDEILSGAPVMCKAAILSCCADDKQQQLQCFNNFGCTSTFNNGRGCSVDSVNDALETFKVTYSPLP